MLESFQFSLNATMPVFFMMLIGALLKKIGLIDDHFASVSDKFVFKGTLPVLLFMNLWNTDIRSSFDFKFVGFCAAVTILTIAAVWTGAKLLLKDKSLTGEFVQTSYRSSAAILGTAFIQNIYGTVGSAAPLMIIGSVPLYNVFAVLILNMESPTLSGEPLGPKLKKAGINILKNPIILGIFFGTIASLIRLPLPTIVTKTATTFSGLTSPLALLSIGATFKGSKAIKKIGPTMAAALLKTVVVAGVFLPFAILLGFRDEQLIALIIMLGSPSTPTAYIMAKNLGHEGVLSSSVIVATTLLSSVTLTFWIFLLRYLGMIL